MAEVGDDVLESGTRLEKNEGVGFVWVGGFLEDVEYCYAGFWRFVVSMGGERKEKKKRHLHGCVKVAAPDSSPACACGFGFKVDDLAVG